MISLFILVLSFTIRVNAQSTSSYGLANIQRFEGNVDLGMTYPVTSFYGHNYHPGVSFGLELRYNLIHQPLSLGILLEQIHTEYERCGYTAVQTNKTSVIALTGDWNFKQGSKVNPFAGLTVGYGSLHNLAQFEPYAHNTNHIVVAPRIGLELGYYFRTHLDLNIVRKGFSNAQLSIGANIGGHPKKN